MRTTDSETLRIEEALRLKHRLTLSVVKPLWLRSCLRFVAGLSLALLFYATVLVWSVRV